MAATLDFTSFFTIAFLGAALFFYSLAVFGLDITLFGLDITLFVFVYPKACLWPALGLFNLSFFPLPQEEKDLKHTLTVFDFITNYIHIYLLHANYSLQDNLFAADLSTG